ncbi:unnamed protein product [Rotaria magnacalcarata]|uniref:Protein RER1 n=1 Tax=Rotaria magnacalcarata TaxID=392030 RepID=A0A816UVL8_9BILA|nr:unnamed protein product [Rotaria magnacalcarata]CAF1653606.1 unnamed protein product [Rotaria magnacalcarata]CAF1910200.1 unnamed protein product [Rotaria magnacalcarata]CAF2113711.1 unnamed protein product [Rotaria magnacalcarata]CAF2180979.1 unnamed protein product [Rotaria magnacalcarata]
MDSNKNVTSFNRLEASIQYYLDRITPYTNSRWLLNLFLLIIFFFRIVYIKGFYIIAYGLGILLLNQLILFLTPKLDLSLRNTDEDDDALNLPTRSTDEFRPFIRRLPEFKFWYITFKALIISLILTLFSIFNIPVFWPILLIYFCFLFLFTMRQRILHMIQHRYVPFTYGKIRYTGKNTGQQPTKFSTN